MRIIKSDRKSTRSRQLLNRFTPLLFVAFYIFGISAIGLAAPPAPTVYLQPGTQTLGPDSTFTVEVREDSGASPANAVQADFNYPADLVDYVSFDSSGSAFSIEAQASGGSGQITIARGSSASLTGDQLITKVNFKSKFTSGTASMTFRPNTALVSSTTNQNLLSSVSATGSANYTIDALGPDLSITAPVSGSTLSGPSVNIEANAADSAGVAGVQFMLDGNNLGAEITASPYSFVWDSATVADGTHTLSAVARDSFGNTTTSSPVSITIANTPVAPDTTSPTDPSNLVATAASTTQVNLGWAASTDAGGSGLHGYQIYRDSTLISTTTNTSYNDTALSPSTTYAYYVVAYDNAGNQSMPSNQVTVTTLTPPPVITNLSFASAADAYVRQDKPTSSYGSSATLITDASPNEDILMRFNVSGVGSGKVNAAKLRLYVNKNSNSGGSIKKAVSSTWNESTLNWNNKPAAGTTVYGNFGSIVKNSYAEVNLSSMITGDGVYDLYVDSGSTNDAAFNSKEAAANKPQLVLTVAK
jgi:chitodextrinase